MGFCHLEQYAFNTDTPFWGILQKLTLSVITCSQMKIDFVLFAIWFGLIFFLLLLLAIFLFNLLFTMLPLVSVLNSESVKLFLLTEWIKIADPGNEFTNKFCCSYAEEKLFGFFFSQWHIIKYAEESLYFMFPTCNAWRSLVLLFKHYTTPKSLKFKYREVIVQKQFCFAVPIRTLSLNLEMVLY